MYYITTINFLGFERQLTIIKHRAVAQALHLLVIQIAHLSCMAILCSTFTGTFVHNTSSAIIPLHDDDDDGPKPTKAADKVRWASSTDAPYLLLLPPYHYCWCWWCVVYSI